MKRRKIKLNTFPSVTRKVNIAACISLVWMISAGVMQECGKRAGLKIHGVFALLLPLVALLPLFVLWVSFLLLRRRKRKFRFDELKDLLALTPKQFEKAIADLHQDLGFKNVVVTGRAGDLSADITCKDRDGNRVIIQCKRYAPGSKIGSRDIQMFIGMVSVHHNADYGIFVTTSSYSDAAHELAAKHNIELIDATTLTDLMQKIRRKRPIPASDVVAGNVHENDQ